MRTDCGDTGAGCGLRRLHAPYLFTPLTLRDATAAATSKTAAITSRTIPAPIHPTPIQSVSVIDARCAAGNCLTAYRGPTKHVRPLVKSISTPEYRSQRTARPTRIVIGRDRRYCSRPNSRTAEAVVAWLIGHLAFGYSSTGRLSHSAALVWLSRQLRPVGRGCGRLCTLLVEVCHDSS